MENTINLQNNLNNAVEASQPVQGNQASGFSGWDFFNIALARLSNMSDWDGIQGALTMILAIQDEYPDNLDSATKSDIAKLQTYLQNKDMTNFKSTVADLVKNHDGFSTGITPEETQEGFVKLLRLVTENGLQGTLPSYAPMTQFNKTQFIAAWSVLDFCVANVYPLAEDYDHTSWQTISDDTLSYERTWSQGQLPPAFPAQFLQDLHTAFCPYYILDSLDDSVIKLTNYAIDGDDADAQAFEADISLINSLSTNPSLTKETQQALANLKNYEQTIDSQITSGDSITSSETAQFNKLAKTVEATLKTK